MALTQEERAQAEIHAHGALMVYDQMQAQIKATEEDILKKIDAFKLLVNNEIKALKDKEQEAEKLSVVKDKEGIHEPETSPAPEDFFHEEKSKQLQEGDAELEKESTKASKDKAAGEAKKQDEKASKAGKEYSDKGVLPEDEQALLDEEHKSAFGSPNTDKPEDKSSKKKGK